jgi:hypothetical protein
MEIVDPQHNTQGLKSENGSKNKGNDEKSLSLIEFMFTCITFQIIHFHINHVFSLQLDCDVAIKTFSN